MVYVRNKTLHVSDSSSVHHQEFLTVHTAMVYVIQFCWEFAISKTVWHIPLLCVQWETPDDGQRNCPKHVEFYSWHIPLLCVQWETPDDGQRNYPKHVEFYSWHIPLLCVRWETPDDGQRNCSKHVEFYSKNKFEKLAHLVGFIIRIYHDARSPERQIHHSLPYPWRCSAEHCLGNTGLREWKKCNYY